MLLIATGVDSGFGYAIAAAGFAAANVVAGVLAYQATRLILRRVAALASHAASSNS